MLTRNAIRKKVNRETKKLGLQLPVKISIHRDIQYFVGLYTSPDNNFGQYHLIQINPDKALKQSIPISEVIRHELYHAKQFEDGTLNKEELILPFKQRLAEIEACYYGECGRRIKVELLD